MKVEALVKFVIEIPDGDESDARYVIDELLDGGTFQGDINAHEMDAAEMEVQDALIVSVKEMS